MNEPDVGLAAARGERRAKLVQSRPRSWRAAVDRKGPDSSEARRVSHRRRILPGHVEVRERRDLHALVTSQLPIMVPTANVRVSLAVAPLLSVTVKRAVPLPPLENVIVPLLPVNALPATSDA